MKMNAFTGNNNDFDSQLKKSIADAESVDIIVSFLMKSGVKLIINDLKKFSNKLSLTKISPQYITSIMDNK